MNRAQLIASLIAAGGVILCPHPAHAAVNGVPYPVTYNGVFTYNAGFLGNTPCPFACEYCNKIETYARALANAVTPSLTGATARPFLHYPLGGPVVFPNAVPTAAAIQAFMVANAQAAGVIP